MVGARCISICCNPPRFGLIPPGVAASLTEWNRFWGGDVLISKAACGGKSKGCCWEVDCLAGFEYLDLGERLDTAATTAAATGIDGFSTRNQFYGLELGGRAEVVMDRWLVNGTATCGLGEVHQSLQLDAAAGGGGAAAFASTHVPDDGFAVVPHVMLDAGFNVTRNIRLYAGYDFLYWNREAARPGDQVANTVPTSLERSDFWAHGSTSGRRFGLDNDRA